MTTLSNDLAFNLFPFNLKEKKRKERKEKPFFLFIGRINYHKIT